MSVGPRGIVGFRQLKAILGVCRMQEQTFPPLPNVPITPQSHQSEEWISREDLIRYARSGTLVRTWRKVRRSPRHLWWRLVRHSHVLRIAGRSFCGHISLLLSRKQEGVDLGLAHQQQLSHEHLLPNTRTSSRRRGIERLVASRPWANSIDVQLWLEGFDWGEQYALDTCGTQARGGPITPSSGLQTSEGTPAAIEGTTRSDE
jgi:hypothetical protein